MKAPVVVAAALQWDILRGDVEHNLARAEALLRQAAEGGAGLAVLPELWSTSFVGEADEALLKRSEAAVSRLAALSRDMGLVVAGSTIERGPDGFSNLARVFDRGQEVLAYRKVHLFSPTGESAFFRPGGELPVAETSAGRLAVLICYDIRFPELTRLLFHRKVQVLAVPAQWPASREVHWNNLVQARAIENQCFVVAANRCGAEQPLKGQGTLEFPGDSQVVDPAGQVLGLAEGGEACLLVEMRLRRIETLERLLPLRRDLRPEVYRVLWEGAPFGTAQEGRGQEPAPETDEEKEEDREAEG